MSVRGHLVALLVLAAPAARAADYVPPPIMPVPTAWQGRSQAVLRVLDKLDARVRTLTVKAGEAGHFKSLDIAVRSCMDRPDGLPRDSAGYLEIADRHGTLPPFRGWAFSATPSIGVFESPIFAVQLVSCDGDLVAPAAPPLPPPVPPPAALQPDAAVPADSASPDTATPAATPDQVQNNSDAPPAATAPAHAPAARPAPADELPTIQPPP